MTEAKPVVGFAGLSHLGIVSGIAMASKGFTVIAFDPDAETVRRLVSGDLIISEPGLDEAFQSHKGGIQFTDNVSALNACDVVFISRDTPVGEATGLGRTEEIEALLELVEPALNEACTLVVLSQIRPGFMRIMNALSRPVYHQVETLVFGQAYGRAVQPERIIVGCADPDLPLPENYETVLRAFGCPVLPMLYESAEVAKISINCMLASTVSTTNMLADVCSQVGADWAEVRKALASDRRIGKYAYLAPGLGLSGGNLERDLAAVTDLAREKPVNVDFVEAIRSDSRYRLDWCLRTYREHVAPRVANPRIGILGLAYKQDTHSTKNSPALHMLSQVPDIEGLAYDPVAGLPEGFATSVKQTGSALDVFDQADAVFIMTPWAEFRDLPLADALSAMNHRIIIDPYRMVDANTCLAEGGIYVTLGRGGDTDQDLRNGSAE